MELRTGDKLHVTAIGPMMTLRLGTSARASQASVDALMSLADPHPLGSRTLVGRHERDNERTEVRVALGEFFAVTARSNNQWESDVTYCDEWEIVQVGPSASPSEWPEPRVEVG